MKKTAAVIVSFIIIAILIGFVFARFFGSKTRVYTSQNPGQSSLKATSMTISSPAFALGQAIPKKYSCEGDGVNPPLVIKDVPAGAGSLALIMDDPDAPMGTWTHWVMWNIPANVMQIAENSVPSGAVQGQASSGQNNYGGPCPPSGTHRYYFRLYALPGKLNISSFSDVEVLRKALSGSTVAEAEYMGTYTKGQ